MSKNKTKKRRHPFLVFYALFVAATVLLAAWFYLPIDSFIARHDAERKGYTVASQPEELDYKYYYNHLKSESEQEAYTLICSQLPDFPERIAVPNLSSDEVQEVYTAVSYDNPEFFFLGNSCQYMRFGAVFYFQPTYSMTKEQYIAQMDAVESEANALIANLDAGASDYDKELYIHDSLTAIADYETSDATESSVYTPYGLLVEHKANCEGYSRSMQYLLKRLGVVSRVISGTGMSVSGTENHMWNVVTVSGREYNVDVTWDDPVPDEEGRPVKHSYFNVGEELMKAKHLWDEQLTPETDSVEESFIAHNLRTVSDESEIADLADEALEKGHGDFYFEPEDKEGWALEKAEPVDGYVSAYVINPSLQNAVDKITRKHKNAKILFHRIEFEGRIIVMGYIYSNS